MKKNDLEKRMLIIKDKYISKDGKMEIENLIYSEDTLWFNMEHILKIFDIPEKYIKNEIKTILTIWKKIKSKKMTIKHNENEITDNYYSFELLKKINKDFPSSYFKEFSKWADKTLFKLNFAAEGLKQILFFMNSNIFVNLIVFLIPSLIFSVLYLCLNKTIEIKDISLTLIGVNFALSAFNIPSLISIIKSYNDETESLLKTGKLVDNFFAMLTHKSSRVLINEMLELLIVSIFSCLLILVFNIPIIWKNALSIFSLLLTLHHMLQIVAQIYSIQNEQINKAKNEDKHLNKEVTKKIKKWID